MTGSNGALRDSNGWDGKLRVDRKAVIQNPKALSDSEYSDEDAPPVDQIEADEDLLDDYEPDTDSSRDAPAKRWIRQEIDLVHCRVSSIPALRLERFTQVVVCLLEKRSSPSDRLDIMLTDQKICLRQNQISSVQFPSSLAPALEDLDLYDNLISHIKGLDELTKLKSLDLSFNKIKHIKNVNHLKDLKDIYFVQNKIQKIEGLKGLSKLRNLELAANRIRDIENLESLSALEELWLGKNKINLAFLTNLKIISIQSNRLPKIQGLETLVNLEEFYVSHNALTEISGLDNNCQLRILDISNNQISHLTNLKHLIHLEEVWGSNNQISSFDEVEKELMDKKELNTVYFEGNPLQIKNPVMYRNKVRLALPQIQQIDATFVRAL
ncbi:MAG: hypothetical protein M1827_001297 [Pycnora praestabilis]|nr:MAG: hypothetical protein M1827_001297 [Pycnora praestabilis]